MKKNTVVAIGCIACSMSLLFAGPLTAASTGVLDTVVGSIGGTGGPALQVKLSPNVHFGYTLNSTAGELGSSFAINSENSTIDFTSGNRNEYAIASDYSGYYQRPSATLAGLVAPTTDDSLAFAAYTQM